MSKDKTVVAVGDFHCSHAVGLTPPSFNPKFRGGIKAHYSELRALYWTHYAQTLDSLKPIDVLIVNGDCIDGKGEASGGTEQLTADRNEQVEMAVECINYAKAGVVLMTFGTPYHVGREEDWERQVADGCGAARIKSHDWADVNGLVFDFKHHIPGSQTPLGRHTPLVRERLWNYLWAEHEEYPKAHVILRSHVHYHVLVGGYGWLAMTLPAMQGYGSKFGARKMSGTVDFGLVSFVVHDRWEWSWNQHILKPKVLRHLPFRVK